MNYAARQCNLSFECLAKTAELFTHRPPPEGSICRCKNCPRTTDLSCQTIKIHQDERRRCTFVDTRRGQRWEEQRTSKVSNKRQYSHNTLSSSRGAVAKESLNEIIQQFFLRNEVIQRNWTVMGLVNDTTGPSLIGRQRREGKGRWRGSW